jgi:hypothetical protein
MPEVGNGHIATIVNGPYVHMNGLYNGEGPKSSRAKIPSLVAFQVRTNHTESQLVREDFVLNVREGELENQEKKFIFHFKQIFLVIFHQEKMTHSLLEIISKKSTDFNLVFLIIFCC